MIKIGNYALGKLFNTRSKGLFQTLARRGETISGYLVKNKRYLQYSVDGLCLDEIIGIEGDIVSELNKENNPEYYL